LFIPGTISCTFILLGKKKVCGHAVAFRHHEHHCIKYTKGHPTKDGFAHVNMSCTVWSSTPSFFLPDAHQVSVAESCSSFLQKRKKNRIMLISSSNLGVQHPNQFVFQFVPIIISNPATDRLRHPVLLVVLVPFWRLSEQKNFLSVLYHFQLQLLQMLATYPPNMFTFFISHHQTAQTTHRRIMNGMTQGRFGLPKNVLFFSSIPFFLRKK